MSRARQGRGRTNAGVLEKVEEFLGLDPKKRSDLTIVDAEKLAKSFHGREPREKIEIAEKTKYHTNLAILGELEELGILEPDNHSVTPIRFKPNNSIGESYGNDKDCVWVCAANKDQIQFVDGDQSLDFSSQICRRLDIDKADLSKDMVRVGPVYSICYFADKHHLEGPKYQANGTSYEHHFGEEGGKLPELFYDTLNEQILLVGGSYTITPEGIRN